MRSKTFQDKRGYLKVSWILKKKFHCIQENLVYSNKGVLRGLHFQKKFKQAKILTCIKGEIFDVCVDVRSYSKKFSEVYCFYLNDIDNCSLYIPEGFAHGFLTISNDSIVSYKVNNFYKPKYEVSLKWNDEFLKIPWPKKSKLILSEKDSNAIAFKDIEPIND